MMSAPRARLAVFIGLGLVAGGCRQAPAPPGPSIVFDRVPPGEPGGTWRLSDIVGRVVGAGPGQRIVLYARSGDWYVQPFADAPFTAVRPDSTWASRTHLGTEYAALLVDPEFQPPPIVPALPGRGGGVVAVEVVAGTPPFWRRRSFLLVVAASAVAA